MKLSALADIRQGMVMAGSGVGARPGDWELHVVESADIVDDHLDLSELRSVRVQRDVRSEAHLLNPYDILVTARSHAVKVALVPRDVRRTVAGPHATCRPRLRPVAGTGTLPLVLLVVDHRARPGGREAHSHYTADAVGPRAQRTAGACAAP